MLPALLAGALAPAAALATPDGAVMLAQAQAPATTGHMLRRKHKASTPAAGEPAKAKGAAARAEPAATQGAAESAPSMSPSAHLAPFDRALFRADPSYPQPYDRDVQLYTYGGKHAIDMPRPLLEIGYPMYREGAIGESSSWLGRKNPVHQQILLYGDLRTAAAYNDDGKPGGDGKNANGIAAARLNLDLDWKLTGTERLHFLFRPLDRKGHFTRYEWQGAATADGKDSEVPLNGNLTVGFLEGDFGAITQGITGHYNHVDLPFAVGIVPLLFQNGIWLDDAFTGLAVTVPAMNSPKLDISNMDVTFFAAGDKVSNAVLTQPDKTPDDHHGRVVGVATFAETMTGYVEGGYGYLLDDRDTGATGFDQSFQSATLAFTRRYGGWLSNSVRVIGDFAQKTPPPGASATANGALLLIENSLVTRRPYTLVPYLNLFWGVDSPQSLARDPGAGGILRNTGLNFESDGLTGFPTLDATAKKAAGGALGLEYLFALDQQLVVELAGLQRTGAAPNDSSDYGLGLRYQVPFGKRFILRADGIVGAVNQGDAAAERNISGVRLELRAKF